MILLFMFQRIPNVYQCQACDKSFASEAKLNEHILTHDAGESTHKVCICF